MNIAGKIPLGVVCARSARGVDVEASSGSFDGTGGEGKGYIFVKRKDSAGYARIAWILMIAATSVVNAYSGF